MIINTEEWLGEGLQPDALALYHDRIVKQLAELHPHAPILSYPDKNLIRIQGVSKRKLRKFRKTLDDWTVF